MRNTTNQMLCLQRAPSAESSTADRSGCKPRQTGVWLSLSPPQTHPCSLCDKRFHSLKALGGHQNAHRSLRNKMQKMYYTKFLGRGNKPPFDFPIDDDDDDDDDPFRDISSPVPTKRARNTAEPMANDEIDLELRLSSVPPVKVMNFYDFLPVKKSKGCGLGAPSGSGVNKANDAVIHRHTSPVAYGKFLALQLREGGAGVGGDRFNLKASVANDDHESEPVADEQVGWLRGGRGTRKVTNNTGLDVTLKL